MRVPIPLISILAASLATSAHANPVGWLTKILASSAKTAPKLAPAIPKTGTAVAAEEAARAADDTARVASRIGEEASSLTDNGAQSAATEETANKSAASTVAKDASKEIAQSALEELVQQGASSKPEERKEAAHEPPAWATQVFRD